MSAKTFSARTNKIRGLNVSVAPSVLMPGDLRVATNVDLHASGQDEIRSRRGSAPYAPGSPVSYGAGVKNDARIVAEGNEYVITQVGTALYAQQLTPTPGNPVRIHAQLLTLTVADNVVDTPAVEGMTPDNSDDYTLYLDVRNTAGEYRIALYANPGKDITVGYRAIPNTTPLPATVSVPQYAGSGVTASFRLRVDPGAGGPGKTGTVSNPPWEVGAAMVDLKPANDRVAVFSQAGNCIVSWLAEENRFGVRRMGMKPVKTASWVTNIESTGLMPEGAEYVYGFEKVLRIKGVDVSASSPHRRFNGEIYRGAPQWGNGGTAHSFGSLPNIEGLTDDPSWNYLRVWRSKNLRAIMTDPLSPIDAQGTPSQLFELALISRAELFGTFGSAATGSGFPPGNTRIKVGCGVGDSPDSVYLTDGNDDSVLTDMVDIDRIGLVPIPSARTGAVHAGQIYVAGVNQADVDSDLAEDVLYTTEVYSAYQEQWDPQAFLNAGRNSFKTTMLASYGDDLVVFREGETKRIPGGNVDAGIQILDDKIGIASFRMAGYVPGLGFAAVCTDGYFRFLGRDLAWHSHLDRLDVSEPIVTATKQASVDALALAYVNGKLMMLLLDVGAQTDRGLYVLHVKAGRGWTKYEYRVSNLVALFGFDGRRAAILPATSRLMEIEVDTDTDSDGVALDPVIAEIEAAPVVADDRMLLDVTRLTFYGALTRAAQVTAKSSGITWQMQAAFATPELWAMEPRLNEREYEFIPQPQDLGPSQWVPLRGRFVSFSLVTSGRFFLSWLSVVGVQRPAPVAQVIFPDGGIVLPGPAWAQTSLILLNFGDAGDTFRDATGRGQDFAWGGVGSKTNRVTQAPGKGVSIAGGGILRIDADTVAEHIGASSLTFKAVFSLASGGAAFFAGAAGGKWYWLRITHTCVEFMLSSGSAYATYKSAHAFESGKPYALTFVLRDDLAGRFYYDALASTAFAGPRPTTRQWGLPDELIAGAGEGSGGAGFFGQFYLAALNSLGLAYAMDAFLSGGEPPDPPAGGLIHATGILSYFEVSQSDTEAEQAERFWGMLEAY